MLRIGLRLEYGSWKTIWMVLRSLRRSLALRLAQWVAGMPSIAIWPLVACSRPTRIRARVVFPDPDLRRQGVIDDDLAQLALILRGLYYDMKKDPDALTPTAAADFVEATVTLAQALQKVPADGRSVNKQAPHSMPAIERQKSGPVG
jgi:hypothetical protein